MVLVCVGVGLTGSQLWLREGAEAAFSVGNSRHNTVSEVIRPNVSQGSGAFLNHGEVWTFRPIDMQQLGLAV